VIVIGLGAMGSAAAAYLAQLGRNVTAFDRFSPPHAQGSSHGRSRIYRHAYWEDSRYVSLMLRAGELWKKLSRESGVPLLNRTGALMIAPKDGQVVRRSAESARLFGLKHEIVSADEIRRRWPVFNVDAGTLALFEEDAGYLEPEVCVREQLKQAARAGANLHVDEPVLDWNADGDGVEVRTARGLYRAGRLVITAGPWTPQLLADAGLPLRVTRQVVFWFEPKDGLDPYRADRLPVYLFESGEGRPLIYGFPLTGDDAEGVKVAVHGSTEHCTPESVCREVRPEDEQAIRERLAETLPSLAGRLVRAETCLYTMTPDEHFIIGPHPNHSSVVVAAGFSGHGFKFAPAVGEILGELVTTGRSTLGIEMFSPLRFGSSGGTAA
jgi:sarcosine oxidase